VASAGGGPASCASKTQALGGEAVLQACFDPYKFDKNLSSAGVGPSKGNIVVGSPKRLASATSKTASVKIQGSATKKGRAAPRSPGAGAASDGGT